MVQIGTIEYEARVTGVAEAKESADDFASTQEDVASASYASAGALGAVAGRMSSVAGATDEAKTEAKQADEQFSILRSTLGGLKGKFGSLSLGGIIGGSGTGGLLSGIAGGATAGGLITGTVSASTLIVGSVAAAALIAGTVATGSLIVGFLSAASVIVGVIAAGSLVVGAVAAAALIVGTVATDSKIVGVISAATLIVGTIAAGSLIVGTVAAASIIVGTVGIQQLIDLAGFGGDPSEGIFSGVYEAGQDFAEENPHASRGIVDFVRGTETFQAGRDIGNLLRGQMPGAAEGGMVEQSGAAVIHRGEAIIPKHLVGGGGGGSSVNIEQVRIDLSGEFNPDDMGRRELEQLADRIANKIGDMANRRAGVR